MAKPLRRPSTRKTDAPCEIAAGRPLVPKSADPRQSGLLYEPLPKWIRPCQPTLVEKPPAGPQWVHEIKWDGYRVYVSVADGTATIRIRNGHDRTARFPAIAAEAAALKVRSCVLDGEAVILDAQGRSSFAELHADLTRHGSRRAVLYAFDLLFLDGEALWKRPLEERRLALGSIMPKGDAILLSEDFSGAGADLFRIACENGLEGIVSKRLDRAYHSGGSRDWQKTKCVLTDSFVVIGFQPGSGAVRTPLANLKLATIDGERLKSVGNVGTGFGEAVAAALREWFDRIRTPRCPVAGLKARAPFGSRRICAHASLTAAQRRRANCGMRASRGWRSDAAAGRRTPAPASSCRPAPSPAPPCIAPAPRRAGRD